MMTFEAVGLAMSILLASVSVALIVLAAVVFVHSRGTGTARLFGRVVHRPGLWASAMVCLGVSGLLRMSSIEEVRPSSWQKPISLIDGLTLAFLVLMATYLISLQRAKCRRDREPQARS
ncbi:hypothetical protein ACGF5C_30605 [Micromonospora sp. NPDC047620]|uniref:hypothetical protein n=1 Tax=Micromonospora sp. NPDC047620 TaxID=3364251 RepID=UPI003711B579